MALSFSNIRNGDWLTDTEIHAFQILLKKKFPSLNGLEDPILFSCLNNFPCYSNPNHFIRITLSRTNHWVCLAAGLLFKDEDICLFDSLKRKNIDIQLGEVVKKFFPQKEKIIFRIQNNQKQRKDLCGHFALAFATALCKKHD